MPHNLSNELPFECFTHHEEQQRDLEKKKRWVKSIKATARKNLQTDKEFLRIFWSHRFGKSLKDKFEDYTPEQRILEFWEQFYLDNPDHLEMKGIQKHTNAETGLSYYETGDPLVDEMEKSFAAGVIPDMSKLDFGDAPNISSLPVFKSHTGEMISVPISAEMAAHENLNGNIKHEDFSSDNWLKDALDDDPALRALAERFK